VEGDERRDTRYDRGKMGLEPDGSIRWRIHLRSSPAAVYELLATGSGRARFWARRAEETAGVVRFEFANGQRLVAEILERSPPQRFALTYFGGSRVTFELASNGSGGTDLELREEDVPESERLDNLAGWVTVLLALKAAADFHVDLRNDDPARPWEDGYVDV
jgi:uncharacterized protein YndB with AHSA1/START domain